MNKNTYRRRYFFPILIITLILVGLIALGGYTAYRAGFSQGVVTGQQLSSGDNISTAPFSSVFPGHFFGPAMAMIPILMGLKILFLLGIAGLFIMVISKLFMFRSMRAYAGPNPDFWAEHWHGHKPPWHRKWQAPSEEENGEKTAEETATGQKS